MNYSGMSQFNMDNSATLNDDFGFDGFDYLDPSKVAGPSWQLYSGTEVLGDFNNYPDPLTPSTAPISLNPAGGLNHNWGKSCRTLRSPSLKDSLFCHRIPLPLSPGHNRAPPVTNDG